MHSVHVVYFGVILFSCVTANKFSLEFRLDAEHMSQVDILFLDKYCISLQDSAHLCMEANNSKII